MNPEKLSFLHEPEVKKDTPTKSILKQIIRRRADERTQEVQLQALDRITEGEIALAVNEAINYIAVNGRFEQFHLGGNFVTEEGKANRGRRIIGLDEPHLTERYPFLRHVCLKVVPPETRLQDEIAIQKKIQERLAMAPYNALRIPLLLGELQRPDLGIKAALLERLPRDRSSGSLQTLSTQAREANISLRLGIDVEADITEAFQAFHALGFEHRDINEGNIYLANAKYEDVDVPRESGRVRPRHLRLITRADVYLLDFERTHTLPASQPNTCRSLIDQENNKVRDLLDPFLLEIDTTTNESDLLEAVDGYYDRRKDRISRKDNRNMTS
jgi:hypothetical protein